MGAKIYNTVYLGKAKPGTGGGGGPTIDEHNLGWYADDTELSTEHPTAEAGDYAMVASTGTIWVWDAGNNQWIDSNISASSQHYLGSFPTFANLQSDYPTATAGDFAMVEETGSVWFWNDTKSVWQNTSHFLGYFADESTLPAGGEGDYAVVEDTNTMWVYNSSDSVWRNSGAFVYKSYNDLISSRPTGMEGEIAVTFDGVYLWNADNAAWESASKCKVRGIYSDESSLTQGVTDPEDGDLAITSDFGILWTYDVPNQIWQKCCQKTPYENLSSTSTPYFLLKNNQITNSSIDLEEMSFDFDSDYTEPYFTTQLNFTVDANMATPFLVIIPNNIKWYGDDLDANGDFDPQAGTRYSILFFWDGSATMRAIVQADDNPAVPV